MHQTYEPPHPCARIPSYPSAQVAYRVRQHIEHVAPPQTPLLVFWCAWCDRWHIGPQEVQARGSTIPEKET